MKKMFRYAAATLCGLLIMLPAAVTAQVDKRVEVTKEYEPSLSESVKLPIVPDMTDTVKMRPEIDYDIKPSMYPTDLSATRFKPARVTYWEFNRPTNFYLKLGAGYPINTVADFYASLHDFRKGYIMADANHVGQFGNLKNYFGDTRDCLQAKTKATIAGGVYWGKRMFEGSVSYRNDIDRRYALPEAYKDMMAENEDFALKLRLGDDFIDLSRINFDISLHGDFIYDKSDWNGILDPKPKQQQFTFGGGGRVARRFGLHYVELAAGYDGYRGIKSLKGYKDDVVKAGVRYGIQLSFMDLLVGLDYVYDRVAARGKASHYVLPYAKLLFDVTNRGIVVPYIEVDGSHRNNSYYSLALDTPYVDFTDNMLRTPNTVDYNIRLGVSGKVARERFGYRVFASMSFYKNALYWYSYNYAWMRFATADRQLLALNLEMDYRPLNELLISAGVHARLYFNGSPGGVFGKKVEANGLSPLDAFIKARYTHRKFSVGFYADLGVQARWVVDGAWTGDWPQLSKTADFRSPTYVDLGVDAEWHVKDNCSIFLAGTNLANMPIYHTPFYREQGVRFTTGVKLVF